MPVEQSTARACCRASVCGQRPPVRRAVRLLEDAAALRHQRTTPCAAMTRRNPSHISPERPPRPGEVAEGRSGQFMQVDLSGARSAQQADVRAPPSSNNASPGAWLSPWRRRRSPSSWCAPGSRPAACRRRPLARLHVTMTSPKCRSDALGGTRMRRPCCADHHDGDVAQVPATRSTRRSSIDSPANGSSSSSTFGFCVSAMAISTRRRSPYEVCDSSDSPDVAEPTVPAPACACLTK